MTGLMPVDTIAGRQAPEDAAADLYDRLTELAGGLPVSERTPALPRGRRRARAIALQALYETNLTGRPGRFTLGRIARKDELNDDLRSFAASLVECVESRRRRLDEQINKKAADFPIDQIAAIDRCVLRVALAERHLYPDTPGAVVINEAVEIAKLFGSETSGKFVNGVLGTLLG